MFERAKTRGPRTELYIVPDIIQALNSLELSVNTHDGQRVLDAVAAAFGLRRAVNYDAPQIVIEAPQRRLLR